RTHTACAKVFASDQPSLLRLPGCSGVTTCSPLPPVVLQNATRPSASRRSLSSRAAAITVSKPTSGLGSRSNTSRPGTSACPGSGVPRTTPDASLCRPRRTPLEPIDLQIRLAIAGYARQREQIRRALHRVPLEEALSADAVGRADDRARPPLDVRQQPFADA